MTLFPDKQEKAQQEIDTVVGPNRLPEFSDRASLPYLEAVLQEVLR
jgi:cytochrome P450